MLLIEVNRIRLTTGYSTIDKEKCLVSLDTRPR